MSETTRGKLDDWFEEPPSEPEPIEHELDEETLMEVAGIIIRVSKLYGVETTEVEQVINSRTHTAAFARQLSALISKKALGLSNRELAGVFGYKTPHGAANAAGKGESEIRRSNTLRRDVTDICEELGKGHAWLDDIEYIKSVDLSL